MALIHCDFYSQTLKLSSSICVILPDLPTGQTPILNTLKPIRFPTLFLLHGLSDDHTIWQRRTSIERYATALNLAVVMPAVNRSFYTDMASGQRYWSYVSEEIPEIARSYFPLSSAREDNFVAGLSMGGYGAFKLALTYPENFAAAGSFSGAVDIVELMGYRNNEQLPELELIFGRLDKVAGSPKDLFYLAQKLVQSKKPRPRLFQCCGTKDLLLPINRKFKAYADGLNLEIDYSEGRAGHEWAYWDKQVQAFLKWLQLSVPKSAS